MNRISASEIISRINNKENLYLEAAEIEGDLDFTSIDDIARENPEMYYTYCDSAISFKNCQFKGRVIGGRKEGNVFYSTIFKRNIAFTECKFTSGIEFDKVLCFGNANLGFSVFLDDVFLSHTHFGSYANFENTWFSKKANFNHIHFISKVDFYSAKFSGDTSFWRVTFLGVAYFNSSRFGAPVDFKKSIFNSNANFKSTTFSDKTSFNKVQFNGMIKFNKAKFSPETDFAEARHFGEPFEEPFNILD